MLAIKQEIPFLRILIPFTMGILTFYTQTDPEFLLWLGYSSLILFLGLFSINIFYKYLKAYRFKGVTGSILYILLFLLGGVCCLLNKQILDPLHYANTQHYSYEQHNVSKQQQYLKIWVNDEPQLKNGILRFKAEVNRLFKIANDSVFTSKPVSGKLMVAVKTDTLNPLVLKYGDELILPANFSEIEPPYNPAEFNYKSWLAAQNIYHQTFLKARQLIKLNHNNGNTIIVFALQLRAEQVSFYRKLLKNDDAFAVASTLILGYRADLSDDTLNIYAKTGTIHALSVSGMHVGLIYLVLNWLLQFLNHKRLLRGVKILLILTLIWFYALLTGFSPSVLRSVIMLSVFIIAKTFSRNTNSYNIVAFTAFCLLLYHPFFIWDVGFQLSFLAVIGLIWLQPKIQNWWYIENNWLNKLWKIVAMSLGAQLITYPFSIYYFHQFPLYFLISNLFIMLPVALLMYLGIIILLGRFDFLSPVFEWLINFTNSGLNWIENLPFSSLSGIWINKIELSLLCFAIIFFVFAFSTLKKSLLFISLIGFITFQSLLSYDKIAAKWQKKIIIFNLQKNYAAAFITGRNAVLLTDLKSDSKTFKYFVAPALEQHRITKINYLTGDTDTVITTFSIKKNDIRFFNYRINKIQLLTYNLKKIKAYLIDVN